MATITAVSFDADGTLWDFDRVMREALLVSMDKLRRIAPNAADRLSLDTLIAIRDAIDHDPLLRHANVLEQRYAAFQRALATVDIFDVAIAEQLNEVYQRHRFDAIRLFDDALPTLDRIRGLELGLVSNGNSYPDRCGLPGRFGFVVMSQDHGVKKPDPGIFHIALDQARCHPSEMLHVGDSVVTDVAGAVASGIWAVWLNRGGQPNDTAIEPDFEIRSLSELPDVIHDLGGGL